MNGKYIFPLIDVQILNYDGETHIRMETYLRKTYRRKYYLWHFYKEMSFKEIAAAVIPPGVDTSEVIISVLNNFYGDIYRTLIMVKVDPKLRLHTGGIIRPMFEIDPDQTPEGERLIKIQLKR